MKNTKQFIVTLMLIFCLAIPGVSHADWLWINASDFSPEAKTVLYFGFGDAYPVDKTIDRESIAEYYAVGQDDEKQQLESNPGGLLATNVSFESPGTYRVAAALKPGWFLMYRKDGKVIKEFGKPKPAGLENIIKSLRHEKYAKAVINAGGESDDSFKKAVGHNLEIIPLKNPSQVKVGDYLPVRLMFKGKPLASEFVYATYTGFTRKLEYAFTVRTDGKGEANIKILHSGPWLIQAEMRISCEGGEFAGKCNKLAYFCSLAFSIE